MTGKPAVLHAGFPTNVALGPLASGTGAGRQGDIDDTAVDAAFHAADVVIAQRMVNQRLAPCSIEAPGVVAHYEPGRGDADHLVVDPEPPHSAHLRGADARPGRGLRAGHRSAEVGGGFGAKINIYGEEHVATALSKRLGLPVKWIEGPPLGGVSRHRARARPDRLRRADGHPGRQGARAADADHRRHRRLQHAAHRARADTHHDDGQRDLRVSRHPRDADRGLYQQDPDRRVSRRRTPGGRVLRRAGDGFRPDPTRPKPS